MIWRSAILVASASLAYVLLRGWPDALPVFMRACLAVLALVAGVGLWAKRKGLDEISARERRTPTWLDYTAIASAVLALECGFLLLLGTLPRPLESAAIIIEQHFRPQDAAQRAARNGMAEPNHGNWLWTHETRRPLPKRTNFKPGLKPELFLRLQDRNDAKILLKDRVFVRAFALSHYENASWAPLTDTRLEVKADSAGYVKLARSHSNRSILHEVFHAEDPAGQNALSGLQGATEARISPLTRVDDGLHLLPPGPKNGGYQYMVRSEPMRLEQLPDGKLIRAWPGAADDLLAIPETGVLAERLRVLAREAAGKGSTKEQLLQLQTHLKLSFKYSLITDNPGNLDPMENFLFDEKRGHCELFATAGALMARALGIPSRVAYGWAGGTWYESAGLFVFRANEAHSWTELWLENHGWVMMDPTPQASTGADRARVAPAGEKPTDSLADDGAIEDELDGSLNSRLPQLALALMFGFALPAGLIAILRRNRNLGSDPGISGIPAPGGGEIPGYFRSWQRACVAHGRPMRPGTTLRRQISKLPETPHFADELLSYHYGTRYEGRAVDPKMEKSLTRKIREWEAISAPEAGIPDISE